MQIDEILSQARESNKNILIIGCPRSGTHALGSLIHQLDPNFENLGEIFRNTDNNMLGDLKKICSHDRSLVSHAVQLASKVFLAPYVDTIKDHAILINLKRNNKIKQFASWMYFNKVGGYMNVAHNHTIKDTALTPGSITVAAEDVDRFIVEQLTDDFFLADHVLFYENLNFNKSKIQQNQYSFDIEKIFANLDYVKKRLAGWVYPNKYYDKY